MHNYCLLLKIFLESRRFRLILLLGTYDQCLVETEGIFMKDFAEGHETDDPNIAHPRERSESSGQLTETANPQMSIEYLKARREIIHGDWLELARVIDRIFFLVFAIIAVVTVIMFV